MVTETVSLLTDQDLYLFNEGSHFHLYEKLGARVVVPHSATGGSAEGGTYFTVWAPNADHVSVIGAFNDWEKGQHALRP